MQPTIKRDACAFLSTSFGFGPVSKAVTIATELKRQARRIETHYFGSGVDYDFAKKSETFDQVFSVDVDQRDVLLQLIPSLCNYHSIFSVLNFDILSDWPAGYPPLYVVDSLAWMWPTPPLNLDRATAYFVQNYLMEPERIQTWSQRFPMVIVGAIRPELERHETLRSSQQLLVNFSGCSNPFAPPSLFQKYVEVLARAVLINAELFDRVIFCCNEQLGNYLQQILSAPNAVVAGHLPHDEFLKLLSSCSALLTSPGITTTLEASALGKRTRFLLPQNYSQALMSERYRTLIGDQSCMALSRFLPSLAVPSGLPEEEGVNRVIRSLENILYDRGDEVREMIGGIIRDLAANGAFRLPLSEDAPDESGQITIVRYALNQRTS
jgi:hypothetical protein